MYYSLCQQKTEEQHLIIIMFIDSNQIKEEQINVQILTPCSEPNCFIV